VEVAEEVQGPLGGPLLLLLTVAACHLGWDCSLLLTDGWAGAEGGQGVGAPGQSAGRSSAEGGPLAARPLVLLLLRALHWRAMCHCCCCCLEVGVAGAEERGLVYCYLLLMPGHRWCPLTAQNQHLQPPS
jgi:hypothetical protein